MPVAKSRRSVDLFNVYLCRGGERSPDPIPPSSVSRAWEPLAAAPLAPWASPIEAGCYRLWPHRDPTAGAFAAGLRLVASLPFETIPGRLKRSTQNRSRPSSPKCRQTDSEDGLRRFGRTSQMQIQATDEVGVVGLAESVPSEIAGKLRFEEWPLLATIQKRVWRPEHLLGLLQTPWFQPDRGLALTFEEAAPYLRGEPLLIEKIGVDGRFPGGRGETSSTDQPWAVATYQGKPLGWVKIVGEIAKNHLPKVATLLIGPAR